MPTEPYFKFRYTHVKHPLVDENTFLSQPRDTKVLPTYEGVKDALPKPRWKGHESAIACYWRAWELAFKNVMTPSEESGFIANFIDTAFNECIFMWDSCFILHFGRYGDRTFTFQRTLDNFYAKQEADGYIPREINRELGRPVFERLDPSSTGPNMMPWCEWEYYRNFGDKERLARVFPVLLAYTQWFRKYLTWQDGTYISCGWGCGMDNLPRVPKGCHEWYDHGHMSWIDTTLQAIFADSILVDMAKELGKESMITEEEEEIERLSRFVNKHMWNDNIGMYVDRFRDGTLSDVKTMASFWELMTDCANEERLARTIAHLENEDEFNRPHRVPALSADHPEYDPEGGYWKGGIWAPTTYMVLCGLTRQGYDTLAHEIAMNHHTNVVKAYEKTNTLFENYAPEYEGAGQHRTDFVGWTGISPITVLFEYVFGIRPNVPEKHILWDVRLTDEHGVKDYPFGTDATLTLSCDARSATTDEPNVTITSNKPVRVNVRWDGGEKTVTA